MKTTQRSSATVTLAHGGASYRARLDGRGRVTVSRTGGGRAAWATKGTWGGDGWMHVEHEEADVEALEELSVALAETPVGLALDGRVAA